MTDIVKRYEGLTILNVADKDEEIKAWNASAAGQMIPT